MEFPFMRECSGRLPKFQKDNRMSSSFVTTINRVPMRCLTWLCSNEIPSKGKRSSANRVPQRKSAQGLCASNHGRSRTFLGGNTFSKNVSKNSLKYSKNIQKIIKKNFQIIFKKISKNFGKFLKIS